MEDMRNIINFFIDAKGPMVVAILIGLGIFGAQDNKMRRTQLLLSANNWAEQNDMSMADLDNINYRHGRSHSTIEFRARDRAGTLYLCDFQQCFIFSRKGNLISKAILTPATN